MVSQIRTYMMRHVPTTFIWNRNNVGTHKCHGAAPRATPCCRTFLWPRPNWYRFPRPTNEHDNDLTDCRKLDLHGNWCIFSRFRGSLHGDYAIIASLTTSVCLTAHLPATPSRFSIGLRTCVTSHAVEPPNTPIVPLHKTSRSLTEAGQQDQAPLVTVCRPGVGWGFFGWGVFPEEIVAAEGGWRLISSNLPRDREKQHPAD